MKVEFSCIIARDVNGKVLFAEGIADMYSEICITLHRNIYRWGI